MQSYQCSFHYIVCNQIKILLHLSEIQFDEKTKGGNFFFYGYQEDDINSIRTKGLK